MTPPQPARLSRPARELHALTEVARAIAAAASLPDLLNSVLAQLSQVLPPAEQGLILLRDKAAGELRAAAAFGVPLSASRPSSSPLDISLLQPVLEQRQPLL